MEESVSKGVNPIRRFAVQPIETTTTSSRKKHVTSGEEKPTRRFLPQPEETTVRSNRIDGRWKSSLPQAEETTVRTNRKSKATRDNDSHQEPAPTIKTIINGERQFLPQLIETTKRTRKSSDPDSTFQQADKTDISPGDRIHQPRHIRLRPTAVPAQAPDNTPAQSSLTVPQSRFSYASLSAKKSEKKRSFAVPVLTSIDAGAESDDSASYPPSLSTTPSAISEEVEVPRVRRIHTESHDKKEMNGYMLSLAARKARKQLQEQALAGFPNEREHASANHFALDDDSDEEQVRYLSTDPDFFHRRMSNAGWDLVEMQKHKEFIEEERRQKRLRARELSKKESEYDPWHNPYEINTLRIARFSEVEEVSTMQCAAKPPMLGDDLVFPKALSPKHTMMDPTQKPVCNKHRSKGSASRHNSGLWTPHTHSPEGSRKNTKAALHLDMMPSPGLWGGFCQNNASVSAITKKQSGLMTPGHERADPYSPAPTPTYTPWHQPPHTPDLTTQPEDHLLGIEAVLQLEATIDEEYPDCFVTQVYNYLSLGYPALARDYDVELSKISRVPVDDIRRNDSDADMKGHIGAPESEGWNERRTMDECGRWRALRLYIREWARQQPNFKEGSNDRNKARKGSWGI